MVVWLTRSQVEPHKRLSSKDSLGLSGLTSFLQVGAIPANALDDGQWSQGLISAVSV